jgi:UDP-glucose 4-epimerase
MIPKILITGGLGNLGSWVTDYFLRNTDWDIYISSSKTDKPIFFRDYSLLTFDISKKEELRFLKDFQFDYIIHLASNNNTDDPSYSTLSYQVNTQGTENLIAVLDHSSIKKFIYFSTFHVYGEWREDYLESSICKPLNDYGNSHFLAEDIVEKSSLDFVIFRLSNSYGCPMLSSNSMWHLMFNDLCKMSILNNELVFNSNAQAYRDFIWMGDVCKIILQSFSNTNLKGVYNLSSGESIMLYSIADEIKSAYYDFRNRKLSIKLNENDKSEYKKYQVSNQKLKIDLGNFEFKTQFKEEALKIFNSLTSFN